MAEKLDAKKKQLIMQAAYAVGGSLMFTDRFMPNTVKRRNFIMKKLIAAALTGALVLGTVGTSVVFAADDDKTITVAASETPHSEILEAAKPILEEEGYDLEVTVFDDYVQPNEVVESGDFDANYFWT